MGDVIDIIHFLKKFFLPFPIWEPYTTSTFKINSVLPLFLYLFSSLQHFFFIFSKSSFCTSI